ncbi:MAG TPA: HEAT repeat domain-containing protein [Armatimonadota bacterium]|nr:HEAT repeat domain-containing protein [Armatimonadota bacterium]
MSYASTQENSAGTKDDVFAESVLALARREYDRLVLSGRRLDPGWDPQCLLPKKPRAAQKALVQWLRDGPVNTRVETATALGDCGVWAVEPLCLALQDREPAVRIAAAESLGHLGDQRAVQPLTGALRACFLHRSGWKQLVMGPVVLVGGTLLFVFCLLLCLLCGGGSTVLADIPRDVWKHFRDRRSQGRLVQAITGALVLIAERHPTPELRSALPDLKAMATDVLQQEPGTRAASRDAAHRINALTEKLKSLPVPASTPAPDAAALPRPAGAPTADAETLPRVS